jgi:hypothetical protein
LIISAVAKAPDNVRSFKEIPMLCKSGVAALAVALLVGAVGLAPAHDSGDAEYLVPTRRFTVYDALGRKIGDVLSVDDGDAKVAIGLEFYGLPFVIFVRRWGFTGTAGARIVYRSYNCTGRPHIEFTHTPLPGTVVGFPGNTIYLELPWTPLVELEEYGSQLYPDGWCQPELLSGAFVPSIPLLDLNVHFVPPYMVR